jgi:hypothetical protein
MKHCFLLQNYSLGTTYESHCEPASAIAVLVRICTGDSNRECEGGLLFEDQGSPHVFLIDSKISACHGFVLLAPMYKATKRPFRATLNPPCLACLITYACHGVLLKARHFAEEEARR